MKAFRNQKGSGIIYAMGIIMFASVMLALMLTMAAAITNVQSARRTINTELAAISYEITQQTYTAMREGNLAEYEAKLSDPVYEAELRQQIIRGIETNRELENDNMVVDNIRFDLSEDGEQITYTLTVDAVYYLRFIGREYPVRMKDVSLTGSHLKHLGEAESDTDDSWYSIIP